MRRAVAILLCVAATVGGAAVVAPVPPAAGQSLPPDDPARGLIYSGLRRGGPGSHCRGLFEVVTRGRAGEQRTRCTHGPDPVPPDLDLRPGQDPSFGAAVAPPDGHQPVGTDATTVGCYGNGTDAYRVQLVYAREESQPDRLDQFEASFRAWAARVDDVVNTSAAKTGGIRHVRYVTDASCRPVIERVVISPAAVDNVATMQQQFDTLNLDRFDRKYLVWVDTPKERYCGQGFSYEDTRHDPTPGVNYNNGYRHAAGLLARVDTRCWGQANSVEAHELMHTLGAVQSSPSNPFDAPPHATDRSHCTDEHDVMCYADGSPLRRADGSPTSLQYVCPSSHGSLLDCNGDDYFHTNPPAGNWLASHWNTAASAWLERGPPPGTAGSTAAGSAWYANGSNSQSGPAGTTIRVYAVGLFQNVPYQLVTGRDGGTPGERCRVDLVPVNPSTRYANSSGFVSTTVGTVNRLPGVYEVCFAQTDPVTGSRSVSGAVTFTVT